jgi:hypothetical protein
MLTSAECQAQAERKFAEAECADQHRAYLCNAAEAWLVLAKQMRQGETASRRAVSFLQDHGMNQQ